MLQCLVWEYVEGKAPSLPGLTSLSFSNSAPVRRAAQQYGLQEGGENDDWTLYWTDYSVSLERVMEMKSYQVSESELVLSTCGIYPVGSPLSPEGILWVIACHHCS